MRDGTFQYERPARANECYRLGEPFGRTGCLDDDIGRVRLPIGAGDPAHAELTECREFFLMLSDKRYPTAGNMEYLRTQQAEFSVTKNDNFYPRTEVNLFKDLEGCGEWFGKNRRFIRYILGYLVEACDRKSQIFRKTAVGIKNPHHLTIGAMSP